MVPNLYAVRMHIYVNIKAYIKKLVDCPHVQGEYCHPIP